MWPATQPRPHTAGSARSRHTVAVQAATGSSTAAEEGHGVQQAPTQYELPAFSMRRASLHVAQCPLAVCPEALAMCNGTSLVRVAYGLRGTSACLTAAYLCSQPGACSTDAAAHTSPCRAHCISCLVRRRWGGCRATAALQACRGRARVWWVAGIRLGRFCFTHNT